MLDFRCCSLTNILIGPSEGDGSYSKVGAFELILDQKQSLKTKNTKSYAFTKMQPNYVSYDIQLQNSLPVTQQ